MANLILLVQWSATATLIVLVVIGFFATARLETHVRPTTATLADRLVQQLPLHCVPSLKAETTNGVDLQVALDPQTGEVVATHGATSKRLPPHEAMHLLKLLRSVLDERDLPIVYDVALVKQRHSQS